MPIALLALALGGFGIGLTEFVIAGLLPEVSRDLGVTEAAAGMLISGYALSVAVGAIGLTAAVHRFDRKRVLVGLMVLFIAGNLVSALAPGYEVLMIGRVLSALTHGAFFGIGAVVAASLVAAEKRAGAIALMFGGLTIANVLGVPFGTLLGQQLGWRATFWAITVIGVVALIGIALLLPARAGAADAAEAGAGGGLRGELRAFARPQVWFSLAVTVLGFGGMFGAFTYIAFTLTGVSGFASAWVPWLLVLFGLGMFAGNWAGGRAADRSVPRTLAAVLGALVLVLAAFAALAAQPVAAVILLIAMGVFGFATVPALQLRIMGDAGDAPTLASGANIAAFNVGNALGAWLGGLAISAGGGYTSPLWVGAVLTAGALATFLIAEAFRRRGAARTSPAETAAPAPVTAGAA